MLELHMETSEEGEVTPVVPVTWKFTDELVNKLMEGEYANPYLIIAVGYEETYGYEMDLIHFVPTKVYVRRLLDASPKEFIQFSKVGKNVVLAFVVNVERKSDEALVWKWQRSPGEMSFDHTPKKGHSLDVDTNDDSRFQIASFQHDVIVPAELFAPEPPQFLKTLVNQFHVVFNTKAFDQCDFRRRVLISLTLSVPVQIYGIFARLLSLLYAIIAAKRDISLRKLFALNPHDFGNYLDTSFWYTKKDRSKRNSLIKWLSPPQLLLYAAIATGALLPGVAGAYFGSLRYNLTLESSVSVGFTFSDVLFWAAIIDSILIGIVGLCLLAFTRKGHRLVKAAFRKVFKQKEYQYTIEADPNMFDLLRKQIKSTVDATPDQVQNKTVHLRFQEIKSWVCKPFARITS